MELPKPLGVAVCGGCDSTQLFTRTGVQIWPTSDGDAPPPHVDMPEEIRREYDEAASILSKSPRGAAAILRLALQKLCPLLGATEKDINPAIAQLVAAGKIGPELQQALDTLRVIGNESVHPGTMDMTDDVETASALCNVLNYVIEKAISDPKKIAALYNSLPEEKLKGIARRDSK